MLSFRSLAQKLIEEKSPGGADWADPSDLNLYLKGEKDSPLRGYLGLLPNGKMLRIPERLRCAHTLIVGATGARKSTAYHKPNLVTDAEDRVSAIVIDLKYPDTRSGFFDMVPLFASAGHDVQLFLPYSDHTLHFPLLANTDTAEGASEIADMLAPDTGQPDVDFYRGEERRLVTGLLMGLARDENSSLGNLHRLLKQGRSAVQSYVHKHSDAEVRQDLSGFFDFNLQTQGNLIGGLAGKLQAFSDARLDKATTTSPNPRENVDLEGLGLRPTLLYIGIPQQHLQGTKAKMLLKLIKRAIDLALLKTANTHGGRLPNHVSFYLDEFANLGVLPNIAENFATMRSRRVAYHVSLQNRAQGEALYGREQFRSFFTNNFQQVILFPRSLKFEDAEYFSKAMGMKAVLDKSKGTSREGFFSTRRRSELIRQVAEPLLSLETMMTWPEEVGVLLASGSLPTKVLLPRLDEPKVLGTKNPLHPVYEKVANTLNPSLLAEILIAQRVGKGSSQLSQLSDPQVMSQNPSLQPSTVVDIPAQDLTIEKAEASQTDSSQSEIPDETRQVKYEEVKMQRAFLKWLDALVEHPVSVKQHINPKTKQLSKLSLLGVPSKLKKPNGLESWTAKGWLKVSSQEIGLVGEGLKFLDKKRLSKLRELSGTPSTVAGYPKQSVQTALRNSDAEKLRRYIQSNGQRLKGHPLRGEAGQTDLPEATGVYQPFTAMLEKSLVEHLLSNPVPDRLQMRKDTSIDPSRWFVEFPMHELEAFPTIKSWCDANWQRFEGHPARKVSNDPSERVGRVLPETVSLPKSIIKDLLGHVPKSSKPTRPSIEGKRPYLIALELPVDL